MSYILEALKKSQQERELGQVPTLETPSFLPLEEVGRPNLWILLALALAALAVVIALYAALRGGAAVPEPVATLDRSGRIAAPGQSDPDPAISAEPPNPTDAAPSGHQRPASAPLAREAASTETADPARAPTVVTQPQPAQTQRRSPVGEARVAAERPSATQSEKGNNVPPDLIADIEAFKRSVREEQTRATDAEGTEDETALRDLRVPKEVREHLPEFVVSAHIYDKEPSKRFVLINGLKTREGEESREALTVEKILPDGVVLSFEGNRFFVPR
jgi:general secretion pathway protein B